VLLGKPARSLTTRRCLAQPFADKLRPFDQSMKLVVGDISLEQDQTAVGRNSQPFGRDHPQERIDPVGYLLSRLGDRAFNVDYSGPEINIGRQRKFLESIKTRRIVDTPAATFEIENVDARFISLWYDRARSGWRVRLLLALGQVVNFARLAGLIRIIGRILDFGRLACRSLEGPSLLDHHGAAPLDLLLNRGRMQPAIDRKPEQTAGRIYDLRHSCGSASRALAPANGREAPGYPTRVRTAARYAHLAKVGVEGSNPFARSKIPKVRQWLMTALRGRRLARGRKLADEITRDVEPATPKNEAGSS
jgi:hypothetical protein